MSHLDTIAQLAALAAETHDDATRSALLRAVQDHARQAALDGPRAPTLAERVVAVAPDVVALLGFGVAGALHVLSPETAGALALAVLTGRLYPRAGNPPPGGKGGSGGPPSAGMPPSGLVTLAVGALELGGIVRRGAT